MIIYVWICIWVFYSYHCGFVYPCPNISLSPSSFSPQYFPSLFLQERSGCSLPLALHWIFNNENKDYLVFFFSPPSSHCFLLGSLFILIYFITTCCLFNSYYFLLGSDLNYKRITVLYFLTKIFFLQNLIGWKRD